ncbi:MAG: type II toxin-antitoxin system VapC family toxin [bacterium]|nr:type II toxin-antitoxin system VapC family toxin [bacterium]
MSGRETFLSTDYVVDETVTRLKYDLDHNTAARFLDIIEKAQESGLLQFINIDEQLLFEAEAIFRKYDLVKLFFTDCTNFIVCKKLNVERAFAFDRHFTMMGLSLRS